MQKQSAVAKLSSVPVPRPSGGFGEVKLLDPEALLWGFQFSFPGCVAHGPCPWRFQEGVQVAVSFPRARSDGGSFIHSVHLPKRGS